MWHASGGRGFPRNAALLAHILRMPIREDAGDAHVGSALALITAALRTRRHLGLRYAGAWRTVEPHAVGRTSRGRLALLAWQADAEEGASGRAGWRLFDLARLEALEPQREAFTPRGTGDAARNPIVRPLATA
jgi:predicted DNA-binding transcriptional regulator YafY